MHIGLEYPKVYLLGASVVVIACLTLFLSNTSAQEPPESEPAASQEETVPAADSEDTAPTPSPSSEPDTEQVLRALEERLEDLTSSAERAQRARFDATFLSPAAARAQLSRRRPASVFDFVKQHNQQRN